MFKLLYANPCQVSEERWINLNTVIAVEKRGGPKFLISLAHKSPECLKKYININASVCEIQHPPWQIPYHSHFNPLIYPSHQVYEIWQIVFFLECFWIWFALMKEDAHMCGLQVCLL